MVRALAWLRRPLPRVVREKCEEREGETVHSHCYSTNQLPGTNCLQTLLSCSERSTATACKRARTEVVYSAGPLSQSVASECYHLARIKHHSVGVYCISLCMPPAYYVIQRCQNCRYTAVVCSKLVPQLTSRKQGSNELLSCYSKSVKANSQPQAPAATNGELWWL